MNRVFLDCFPSSLFRAASLTRKILVQETGDDDDDYTKQSSDYPVSLPASGAIIPSLFMPLNKPWLCASV
jgi:hypothetical protein